MADLDFMQAAVHGSRGRILAVVTSTSHFPGGEKKAGFELTELARAYYVFQANGYEVDQSVAGIRSSSSYKVFKNPMDACAGADLVTTDVWTSMGYEAENEARKKAFADWCVDAEMMAAAQPDALFMHCLLAHRGEEVEAEVIDGPQSVVWEEAENRMHVQKALMEYLLLGRVA